MVAHRVGPSTGEVPHEEPHPGFYRLRPHNVGPFDTEPFNPGGLPAIDPGGRGGAAAAHPVHRPCSMREPHRRLVIGQQGRTGAVPCQGLVVDARRRRTWRPAGIAPYVVGQRGTRNIQPASCFLRSYNWTLPGWRSTWPAPGEEIRPYSYGPPTAVGFIRERPSWGDIPRARAGAVGSPTCKEGITAEPLTRGADVDEHKAEDLTGRSWGPVAGPQGVRSCRGERVGFENAPALIRHTQPPIGILLRPPSRGEYRAVRGGGGAANAGCAEGTHRRHWPANMDTTRR